MLVAIGRILFSVLFILSGAWKLIDIAQTTHMIADKVVIPAAVAPYATQLEAAAGMPVAQILALGSGILEVICGLLIALNFGARFFAAILILFVVAATVSFHNFWDMTGADRQENLIQALKNLSLIGALLIIVGFPRARVAAEEAVYSEH